MKSLAVQFLASIIVFISLSFSKEDGEGRDHPTYVVFDKKISIKEIIRFGGVRNESHGEMEAPHEKKNLGYLLSQLLANASEAVTLGDDNADNNTGTAVVCGPKGAHLNVTWIPKIIEFGKPVTFSVDMISPTDFNKGRMYVEFYLGNTPIFSLDEDITCSDILKVPKMQQKCPLEKGERIQYSYTDFPLRQPPLVKNNNRNIEVWNDYSCDVENLVDQDEHSPPFGGLSREK